MAKKIFKYKLLIHCKFYLIREGFDDNIRSLPLPVDTYYTDLLEDGILSKLKFSPDLIIILLSESDSDFTLPAKVKLFAPGVPVVMVLPRIPDSYRQHLENTGIDKIIELPINEDALYNTIMDMIKIPSHGNP